MIHFACQVCEAKYKVPDEFAGRITKCRQCAQSLQVPKIDKSAVTPAQFVVPKSAPIAHQPDSPLSTGKPIVQSGARHSVKPIEADVGREQLVDCPLCFHSMLFSQNDLGEWRACVKCRGELIVLACERSWRPFAKEPKQYHLKASARLLHWPKHCICCFSHPESTARISHVRWKGSRSEERSWEVPYCQSCIEHFTACENAQRFSEPKRAKNILCSMGLKIKNSCVALSQAAAYDGWNATVHSFRFLSERYTLAFIEANKSKIVM